MEDNVNHKPTLLAVLAHPDDETFGLGGTLAWYASEGVDVYLVCATRGEAGTVDENYLAGYASIAERREAELCCAARLLGLKGVYFLDYRDSGMAGSMDNSHPKALASAPPEKVEGDVVHYIRKLKPHVVITFDPIGGYMHPDHLAIQKATEKAFYSAGDRDAYPSELPPHISQKLYFHVMPKAFFRIMVKLMPIFGKDPRKFGRNQDINLVPIAEANFPIHAVIKIKSVQDLRDQAFACHASQGGEQMSKSFFGRIRRIQSGRDTFMRAYPQPQNGRKEKDLFEGVVY